MNSDKTIGRTNNKNGHDFEMIVAAWAKRTFKEMHPVITLAELGRGYAANRAYDVDIRVSFLGGGLFGLFKQQYDIWIECKNLEDNIKRADVQRLVKAAQDVWAEYKHGHGLGYNALIIASQGGFDRDALNVATADDVLCLRFQGNREIQLNAPENWINNPVWLTGVR